MPDPPAAPQPPQATAPARSRLARLRPSRRLRRMTFILFAQPSTVAATGQMFLADFARSSPASAADYLAKPWWFRLAARTSRLMAPVQ